MIKKFKMVGLVLLLAVVFLSAGLLNRPVQAVSPALSGLYADPEVAVFGNTYYIYPTTDGFANWSGTYFKCFSSPDLVNWTDRGTILDLVPDVSWSDANAWAPCIVQKSGTYYYYFCASQQIGVATSTSPTGPFVDALGHALITTNQYSCQSIDPDVFIDDDGQAYMFFGQGKCMVVKLNADMKSLNGTPANITPSGYNEASNVFKRNGKYYLMWSENDTRSEDYRVSYGTSTTPMGPYTKAAVNPILVKNLTLGIKGTGHNSVLQIPGRDEWYIVYHRFAIPSGDGTHRETCIDRMEFNADGTIKPVTVTLEGITVPVIPNQTATPSPVVTPTPTTTPTPTPTVGPTPVGGWVAWYKFDETSGTTAADSSGNGRNATLVNGPTWVAGKSGNAVNIDGTNDYVSMPSGIFSTLNDFTIATWVKLDTSKTWYRIFDIGTGQNVYMFLTSSCGTSNVVRFAITTGSYSAEQRISGTAALPTGVWKHVAVTLAGTTGILYVDGVQVGTNTAMTLKPSSLGSTTQNWIGRSMFAADPYLDGQIDSFRIYSRALSAAEISGLYSAGN
jgi:beta-xylosidase